MYASTLSSLREIQSFSVRGGDQGLIIACKAHVLQEFGGLFFAAEGAEYMRKQ